MEVLLLLIEFDILKWFQTFYGMKLNIRRDDVNSLPRSYDLTPLDFFLWGYVKDEVYINKSQVMRNSKRNSTKHYCNYMNML